MSTVKILSFKNNERDKKLLEYIKNKSLSYYVKELIYKDMVACTQSKTSKIEE